MSTEATEAPPTNLTGQPTNEASIPKDTPGEPATASITEGIDKMNLSSQQPSVQPRPLNEAMTKRKEEKDQAVDGSPLISKRNLIINYLPPNLTEGNLATLFSPYGTLEECKIVIDLETGRSRGYGFVKYCDEESATRAKDSLNGYQMDNKRLKVAFARKQCKEIQNANLYVTNIPPHYSEGQLKELFEAFGEIIECRILRNEKGQSRGVGFVRLDTNVHAMTALKERDGHVCEEGAAPLVVKLAQRRKRNYWNTGDQRGPAPGGGGRPGGNRESTSPGQSGRNPGRYQNNGGMGGRRVGGMGGPTQFPMEYERRRDDRDRDRRDVRNSPGFRGRGRGGYGMTGQRHRGRGGPQMGMTGMHAPPNGNMGARGMQPQQYRPSRGGVAGLTPFEPQYNQQPFVNAPSGFYPPPPAVQVGYSQPKSHTTAFSLVVKNISEYYTIDHLIALYAPYGPIHSVNIDSGRSVDKPPFGVVTFFYFDDAKKARAETNGRAIDDKELDVAFESKSQ